MERTCLRCNFGAFQVRQALGVFDVCPAAFSAAPCDPKWYRRLSKIRKAVDSAPHTRYVTVLCLLSTVPAKFAAATTNPLRRNSLSPCNHLPMSIDGYSSYPQPLSGAAFLYFFVVYVKKKPLSIHLFSFSFHTAATLSKEICYFCKKSLANPPRLPL